MDGLSRTNTGRALAQMPQVQLQTAEAPVTTGNATAGTPQNVTAPEQTGDQRKVLGDAGPRTNVDPRLGQGPTISAQMLQQNAAVQQRNQTQSTSANLQTTSEVKNFHWYSQFDSKVKGHGPTGCFSAASKAAAQSGAVVDGPENRFQVATGETKKGRVKGLDTDALQQGKAYIDSELAAGRPVVIGVTDKVKKGNADGITDHFVTITASRVDENGKAFYEFRDPGTRYPDKSTGRLYADDRGNLAGQSPYNPATHYELAMVRKNQ